MSSCRDSGCEDTLLRATWFSSWKWLHYNEAEIGFTVIFATLQLKKKLVNLIPGDDSAFCARDGARCDYGLYVGASAFNYENLHRLSDQSLSLKMYLNTTFSTLKLDSMDSWSKHVANWPKSRPLCVHAESKTTAAIILLAELHKRPIHVCHVARREEINLIRLSKQKGVQVTCEVCPHHLFLSREDIPKLSSGWSEVRPVLCSKDDQEALWDNMDIIDCFATDHAPHTVDEKASSSPPPGFPGLETMLPLLLTAVHQKRLTLEDIILRLHTNPMKIFGLNEQPNTYVEVDLDECWTIPTAMLYSKAKWTPFAGMEVVGRVQRVVLRGKMAYIDGKVLAEPGYGVDVRLQSSKISSSPPRSKHTSYCPISPIRKSALSASKFRSRHCSEPAKDTRSMLSPLPPTPITHRRRDSGFISRKNNSLFGKDIVTVMQFTKKQLHDLFNVAHEMRMMVKRGGSCDILKGKIMASMFYEVSTRTSSSFTAAMQRLGGSVVVMNKESSSVMKGESLEDSIRMMQSYSDIIVLRHPVPGSAKLAVAAADRPIINAGDGIGEHPTQALLDVFTIREEIGTVNNVTVTMVGDLKHGRTVHSLAKLLTVYQVRLCYVSPPTLEMPEDVVEYVRRKGIKQDVYSNMEDIIPQTDVLYMTRIQRERFSTQESYDKVCGCFILTPKLLTKAKERMIIMHPLPRINEISVEVDKDPRAAYFRQAEFGMYVRMALLSMVLKKNEQ